MLRRIQNMTASSPRVNRVRPASAGLGCGGVGACLTSSASRAIFSVMAFCPLLYLSLVRSLHHLRSARVGLALSGGSVRGLAHIGVFKVLSEAGIQPAIVTGTSAGSIIGAGIAAGMTWQELTQMARGEFWPRFLHGGTLEAFCARRLPPHFADLKLPFAAMATTLPDRRAILITTGHLASAISASCAMRVIR